MPKIPQHVAIIMDGNGRWSRTRGLPHAQGHGEGVKALERTLRHAHARGIKYLTVYAFSTENWGRPEDEIMALMGLFRENLNTKVGELLDQSVRLRFIGDRSVLDPDLQKLISKAESATAQGTGVTLLVAMNYGARAELRQAIQKIAQDVKSGSLKTEDIQDDVVSSYLYTAGIPDPDILIRTSGERRLSNYLLWQCAYTEFFFIDTLWPDFNENDFDAVIDDYNKRDRRFGKHTATF